MNPLPKKSAATTAGRTVVVGGAPGTSVPFHQHPAMSIVGGTLDDDVLPERVQPISPVIANADDATENGQWSAGALVANMPAASSWVGTTLRFDENPLGVFAVQHAYEIVSPYRAYRRFCDVFWQSWVDISTSGSGVTSVNGDAGPSVSLSAADVGAEPAITDSGWIAVTYNTNWADFGNFGGVDYRRGQYRKTGTRVRVVGCVKRTGGSTLIPFQLPASYRPSRALVGLFNSNGASGQIVVSTNGDLSFGAVVSNQLQSFDVTFDTDELA